MARFTLPTVLTFAIAALPAVMAQAPASNPSATPASETSKKEVAAAVTNTAQPAAPVAPAPKRPRAISGDVANMLSQTMPKFTPPPPPPTAAEIAQQKADAEAAKKAAEVDLRDVDKPQNEIVRLKQVDVRGDRPPILTERAINTKQGLRDIAMRRYITDADRAMNRFYVPLFAAWSPGSGNGSPTEQRAMFMYNEDERLKNMADLADNANMIMRSDAKAGASVKQDVQSTYMRRSEFGYGGMSPK